VLGGLVPWAVMSGYADEGETAAGAFYTAVDVQDFRLRVTGVTLSYDNRVEVSAAQQAFEIKGVAGDIRQEIFSAKVRVAGDLIYGSMPQIATGVQFKNLLDGDIAEAVGADAADAGMDGYVSFTRLHLGAVGGYNLLWNLSLRATKANQMGLLGYGGDENAGYQLMPEASVAVLLDNGLAVGGEYRQKPDNLSAFSEDDFMDIFIAWFPNKQVNLTLAWADLGSIAGSEKQSGLYASLSAFFY
tara:strand:+ start:2372 stop:3103 length:732 start_codon:yes stop_codon:yes gene_type:complete